MLTYLLFALPAMLLGLWAQWRVQSTYAAASQVPAPVNGRGAARQILDHAGLHDVEIEEIPGQLTDHYDPSHKVLRLSTDVYRGYTAAAVGIAAHEAGHALQDAERYAPLVIRNAAVGTANIGSSMGMIFIMIGAFLAMTPLVLVGIALFSAFVFFQLVNLPVEFDASNRARAQLVALNLVNREQAYHVNAELSAAAWTYVAATLSAVMTLLYYLMIFTQQRDRESI